MKEDNKKNVLFISSLSPLKGPGTIAFDYIKALKEGNYNVDFLTLYPVDKHPEIIPVYKNGKKRFHNFWFKLRKKFFKFDQLKTHGLFYGSESSPPCPTNKLISSIPKEYDIIVIFFWQQLLSYSSVEAIYDKMRNKPKVVFLCADYSPMTGGCHFMGNCQNYKVGCGNCPMFHKFKLLDCTKKNVIERIRINTKIKPIVMINHYMSQFFRNSPVMKTGANLTLVSIILNLDKFKPYNSVFSQNKLGIRLKDKFVILFGCQSMDDEKKGIKYMLESLTALYAKMNEEQRKSIILLSIGACESSILENLLFDHINLGYVNYDDLPYVYSCASVFLSPSINDAGPSMVNQSIACGTPVVAFEIGTAIEVIKNQGTGYCVPLLDTKLYSDAIYSIFRLNSKEYEAMRVRCRMIAEEKHSYTAFLDKFNTVL
ncbi:MAG: glycosyltransferase [Muribaculum sp.]|nr:glycosyltransferase [Muribaculum sp.]